MDITVKPYHRSFLVVGETFEAKHLLKRLGGRWNQFEGAWEFPTHEQAHDAAEEAARHVAMMNELAAL